MPRPATGVTPVRNVRLRDEVWNEAKAIAAERNETMTSIIEEALLRYIADNRSAAGSDRAAD